MRKAILVLLILALVLSACDSGTGHTEEEDGPTAVDPWWVAMPAMAIVLLYLIGEKQWVYLMHSRRG